jgi:hypothetical protein
MKNGYDDLVLRTDRLLDTRYHPSVDIIECLPPPSPPHPLVNE